MRRDIRRCMQTAFVTPHPAAPQHPSPSGRRMLLRDPLIIGLGLGWLALIGLPWYAVEPAFWSFAWIDQLRTAEAAPALLQATLFDRPYLWPIILALLLPLFVLGRRRADPNAAAILIA